MRAAIVLAVLALPALARAEDKPKFTLELTAPKEIYPDEAITVKAAIHNATKEDTQVLRDVDGAFDGLRGTVDFRWVVKADGKLLARRTDIVRIDNHVNSIGVGDLVKVPAGKTADLGIGFGRIDNFYNLRTPGKYTIELRYEFDPTAGDKTDSDARTALQKLGGVRAEGKVELTVLPFPLQVTKAEEKLKVAQAKHQIVTQFAETLAKNPNATAAERDTAAERLKRATAVLADATEEYTAAMTAFRKQRDEDRKKK
jgi:hypothetical protein